MQAARAGGSAAGLAVTTGPGSSASDGPCRCRRRGRHACPESRPLASAQNRPCRVGAVSRRFCDSRRLAACRSLVVDELAQFRDTLVTSCVSPVARKPRAFLGYPPRVVGGGGLLLIARQSDLSESRAAFCSGRSGAAALTSPDPDVSLAASPPLQGRVLTVLCVLATRGSWRSTAEADLRCAGLSRVVPARLARDEEAGRSRAVGC